MRRAGEEVAAAGAVVSLTKRRAERISPDDSQVHTLTRRSTDRGAGLGGVAVVARGLAELHALAGRGRARRRGFSRAARRRRAGPPRAVGPLPAAKTTTSPSAHSPRGTQCAGHGAVPRCDRWRETGSEGEMKKRDLFKCLYGENYEQCVNIFNICNYLVYN